jgi:hypothetical protein
LTKKWFGRHFGRICDGSIGSPCSASANAAAFFSPTYDGETLESRKPENYESEPKCLSVQSLQTLPSLGSNCCTARG